MEYTAHSPEEKGKEVKQESIFSDYKEVDGMKVPRKFVMKRDGKVYVEAELLEPKPAEVKVSEAGVSFRFPAASVVQLTLELA